MTNRVGETEGRSLGRLQVGKRLWGEEGTVPPAGPRGRGRRLRVPALARESGIDPRRSAAAGGGPRGVRGRLLPGLRRVTAGWGPAPNARCGPSQAGQGASGAYPAPAEQRPRSPASGTPAPPAAASRAVPPGAAGALQAPPGWRGVGDRASPSPSSDRRVFIVAHSLGDITRDSLSEPPGQAPQGRNHQLRRCLGNLSPSPRPENGAAGRASRGPLASQPLPPAQLVAAAVTKPSSPPAPR